MLRPMFNYRTVYSKPYGYILCLGPGVFIRIQHGKGAGDSDTNVLYTLKRPARFPLVPNTVSRSPHGS